MYLTLQLEAITCPNKNNNYPANPQRQHYTALSQQLLLLVGSRVPLNLRPEDEAGG